MRDNVSNMTMTHLGNVTVSGTTPAASAWMDVSGYDSATIVMVNNTVTDAGAAAGFTATAQHSDTTTAASAEAIAAADTVEGAITIVTTADDADNSVAGQIGYVGDKRYLRLNVVGTTGSDADVSVFAVQGDASRRPTTFVGASVAAT